MAATRALTALTLAVTVAVALISAATTAASSALFPKVEVTLANDGEYRVWFMCQMTDKSDSLYELPPNETYRFNFSHVAFPMRWCYLYIHPGAHGFFWAYTVRARCTKCFWSINSHPSLYRNDKGRWERQKLFMPSDFDIYSYISRSDKPVS